MGDWRIRSRVSVGSSLSSKAGAPLLTAYLDWESDVERRRRESAERERDWVHKGGQKANRVKVNRLSIKK